MFLTAEQLWMIATVYDRVAADKSSVPSPQGAAFARKAKRLRMLARIAAKIRATTLVSRRRPLGSSIRSCHNLVTMCLVLGESCDVAA